MELADILKEESVLFCTDAKKKSDILERLSLEAARVTGCSYEAIFEAIDNREALGSTGLGNGIAIPHGKVSGLEQVTAVFARVEPAVDFDAIDDQPVDLVMLLLAPAGAGADHLKALALVARLLRTEAVVDEIRAADSVQRIYKLLAQPVAATKAA